MTYKPSYDKQGYDNSYKNSYNDYSKYPTKDKKYECKTGQFKGFFVSSVEFCKLKIREGRQVHKSTRPSRAQMASYGPAGANSTIPGPEPTGPRGPSRSQQVMHNSIVKNV